MFVLYMLIGAAVVVALQVARMRYLSFRAQRSEEYVAGPVFDIRERLRGPMDCEGVIYGPTGRVSSRFVADFNIDWQGNSGRMTEVFHYDSGNVQNREWTLTLREDGRIDAEAADLIGTGHGRQHGSAVVLNYRIKLSEEAGGHVLDVVDWMYLMENGTIMNRSQFRKFGVQVAELVATMRPRADSKAMAAE